MSDETPDPRLDVELPSKWTRVATPGMAIAFIATLGALYFVWGRVFTRDGTGSNVPLGLLIALALLYLVTANVGPFLDVMLFHGGTTGRAQATRSVLLAIDDFARLLVRVKAGKEKEIKPDKADAVGKIVDELKRAYADSKELSDHLTAEKRLVVGLEAAEKASSELFDRRQPPMFTQFRSLIGAFAIALALRWIVVEPFQIPSESMVPTLLIGDHLFVARYMYGIQMPFSSEPDYIVRWSEPKAGDVVVFVAPAHVSRNAGENWIKRVIAGPGQHVRIDDDVLTVDGRVYEQLGPGEDLKYMEFQDGLTDRWNEAHGRHQREVVANEDGDRVEHSVLYSEPYPKQDWPDSQLRRTGLSCTPTECVVDDGYVFVMGDNRNHSNDGRRWGAVPMDFVKGKALFVWMSVDGSERSVDIGRFTLPGFRWDRLFMGIE